MAKIYKLLQLINKGSPEKSFGTTVVELNKHYEFKRKSIVSDLVLVDLERVAGYQVNHSTTLYRIASLLCVPHYQVNPSNDGCKF